MRQHSPDSLVAIIAVLITAVMFFPVVVDAGELEPTEPPGPTMHTLEDIYLQNEEIKQYLNWSRKIEGPDRFRLVLDDDAVLDRETGLVWERNPSTSTSDWSIAHTYCYNKEVANRFGWRLPTIEELATLIDNDNSTPALPKGHPFEGIQSLSSDRYWTTTTAAWLDTMGWYVSFYDGSKGVWDKPTDTYYHWCVRCGSGYDAY